MMTARTDNAAVSGVPCSCGIRAAAGHDGNDGWSRRALLRSGLTAATSLAVGIGTSAAVPAIARAQTTMTPDEALAQLVDGNKRFQQQQLTSFRADLNA